LAHSGVIRADGVIRAPHRGPNFHRCPEYAACHATFRTTPPADAAPRDILVARAVAPRRHT